MAGAYLYAEGDPPTLDLELLFAVERYGALPVFGRPPGVGELRRLATMDHIIQASRKKDEYKDADGNVNWAAWANDHPRDAALLAEAMKAAEGQPKAASNE